MTLLHLDVWKEAIILDVNEEGPEQCLYARFYGHCDNVSELNIMYTDEIRKGERKLSLLCYENKVECFGNPDEGVTKKSQISCRAHKM